MSILLGIDGNRKRRLAPKDDDVNKSEAKRPRHHDFSSASSAAPCASPSLLHIPLVLLLHLLHLYHRLRRLVSFTVYLFWLFIGFLMHVEVGEGKEEKRRMTEEERKEEVDQLRREVLGATREKENAMSALQKMIRTLREQGQSGNALYHELLKKRKSELDMELRIINLEEDLDHYKEMWRDGMETIRKLKASAMTARRRG